MSGAGRRAMIQSPPRRPGGEDPTEQDWNARLIQKSSGECLKGSAGDASSDKRWTRLRNDSKRAIASITVAKRQAENRKGERTQRQARTRGLGPGTEELRADGLSRPKRRSGIVRKVAPPDKRSAAGGSLKGKKPQERRVARPVFAAASPITAAVLAGASTSDPDDRCGRSPRRLVVRWR